MIFEKDFYKKYDSESFNPLDGLYSLFDSKILYCAVREIGPKKILDLGPRTGRTTSSIVQAVRRNNNGPIDYYLFEKDPNHLKKIVDYLESYKDCINLHPFGDIIDNPILEEINDLDLLFIDAFHDHLLCRWYIKNLFPKVNGNGIVHIHDIYYNKNNNGWEDVGLKDARPDVWCSVESLKEVYGEKFFNEYYNKEDPYRYEEDEIRDYIVNNNLDFFSTKYEAYINGFIDVAGAGVISLKIPFGAFGTSPWPEYVPHQNKMFKLISLNDDLKIAYYYEVEPNADAIPTNCSIYLKPIRN